MIFPEKIKKIKSTIPVVDFYGFSKRGCQIDLIKNRTSNVLFSAKESQDRKSWRKFMKIHEIPSMTEILDPYLVSWI
jgi:hypothetical protein